MTQELEKQLADLEARKVALFDTGSPNPDQVRQLNAQIKEVQAQIQEQSQAVEQAVEVATTELNAAFETIEIDGETYPIQTFATNEVAAIALKNWFTTKLTAITTAQAKQLSEIKGQYQAEITDLRQKEQDQADLIDSLKAQLAKQILDKEDAQRKRDAAAAALEDAERAKDAAELLADEKQQHIDKLRDEIAIGAVNAAKVVPTNLDNDALRNSVNEWKQSRPAIYDSHPLDNLGKRYGAKLMENDEYIEFGFLEKGKYREVTAEEAERFRQDRAAEEAAKPVAPSMEDDIRVAEEKLMSVPSFPAPQNAEIAADKLDEGHAPLEMAGEPITLEERIAALEFEVFGEVRGKVA